MLYITGLPRRISRNNFNVNTKQAKRKEYMSHKKLCVLGFHYLFICLFVHLFLSEMAGSSSVHETVEKVCTKFWLENLKGRDHLEDIGVNRKIILEWI
jgi:hypothetical protein